MKNIKILSIIGARPQFIKAAVVSRAFKDFNNKNGNTFKEILLHTGQHYDTNMSESFFKELRIHKPKYNLGVRETSHANQTARMMIGIEEILVKENPDLVIVYGDTNTTLAGALAAAKLKIPIVHIEAGLRSFNRTMPEEINRIVTDHISAYLFCPTQTAVTNLKTEGIKNNIFNVGDVMFDSIKLCEKILKKKNFKGLLRKLKVEDKTTWLNILKLKAKRYYLATIHRAENTDNPKSLKEIIFALNKLDLPVVFPVHPRTKKFINSYGITVGSNTYLMPPVSYLEMIGLEKEARAILTDSGGVQKEAFFLGIPCVVIRPQTEWIETIKQGNNLVLKTVSCKNILGSMSLLSKKGDSNKVNLFGQGDAGKRVAKILSAFIKN